MRRYVIIGTGAVGGTLGGRLAQHDVPVVWVARGEHARVLAQDGMTLRTPDGTYHLRAPVWTGPQDADLTTDDVLVLATKVHQAADALSEWADVPVRGADGEPVGTAGETLPLLTLTNGIATEDLALRFFERVYAVCVWCPASYVEPGEIIARYTPASAVFHLGRYRGTGPDDLARAISEEWTAALIDTPLPDDVMAWKRRKLVMNMLNAVDALIEPGDGAKELMQESAAEARAALAAAGDPVASEEDNEELRRTGPQVGEVEGAPVMASSTTQSLARGTGNVETDYLNGEIVRLGRLYGVPTPVNTALASLARRAAREGWAPKSVPASAVRR